MENRYTPQLKRLGSIAAALFGIYLGVRFALPLFLPLICACLISLPARALSARVSARLGCRTRVLSVAILMIMLTVAVGLLWLLFGSLVTQIMSLGQRLSADPELLQGYLEGAGERLCEIFDRIGLGQKGVGMFAEIAQDLLSNALTEGVSRACRAISFGALSLASRLPTLAVSVAVTLISSFYICTDGDRLGAGIAAALPGRVRSLMSEIGLALKGYVRAYIMLSVITMGVVFIGLLVIGCPYALLISAVIAFVDMLPILGSGAVLLPWSIVCFLIGDAGFGWGLLVIYAAAAVIRQIAEPRLVGKGIGIHPLVALLSTYAGLRLFGFFGMVIGPFLAFIILRVFSSSEIDDTPIQ